MSRLLRRLRHEEGGFTLTELLASSALFALVVLVAGSIFIGQLSAQQQVSAITSTTTDAQLAGTSIDAGIRNSTGFKLTAVSADQLLVARVAGGGSTLQWTCRAWYYQASSHSIRMHSSTPGTPVTAPTSTQLATWTLLLDGVHPTTGTTIFSAAGETVSVSFRADTDDDNKPVAIELSSAPLAGVTENSTCY
jgi:prepilin-type N-terminal cleavage/methylation domain-containing protein